ncbi:oligosaccharide repeat unit polymerase [Aliarcobacter cryaerophilus]|uniref:oligosaccharide repeat unit polymerase n=1 Tax=Aliarcobacter cryaerophilus TaxID=28198 RepID=UPI0021B3442E|nr:oligosaccharide repeat unit polymerase [Aliarcobacter cryaerophilus]MCT7501829.1 oligosaccharide repeat unit polymerase [Aliarcobacter cryaerophilus]
MSTRNFLLFLFVFINVIAFLYYSAGGMNSKQILGTASLNIGIYFINLIFLVSSLVLLTYIFNVITSIKVKNTLINMDYIGQQGHSLLSYFMILLLLVYLTYFILSGGSVAGGEDKLGGGYFGVFVALFQIMFLTLIYIASSKIYDFKWKAIVFLYVLINLLQGWSGFILTLLILYLFYREQINRKVNILKVFIFSIIGIIFFYPVIYFVRLSIRITGQQNIGFDEINIIQTLGNGNIFDFMFYCYIKLLERFEQYYLSLGSLINYEKIYDGFKDNSIAPFYAEGPLKYIFREENMISLGNYLPSLFYENTFLGEYYWNISPGIVSYFFTDIVSIVLFLFTLYISLLIPTILLKSINANKLVFHLIYYYVIVLLFVGWIAQFLYFMYSLVVFYFIVNIIGIIVFNLKRTKDVRHLRNR